eukprot:NODE_2105_length_652_cov_87.904762_g2055_i0.p1 GENE.NODE_2105_length_652_cov_87.904762_g2055_i0~~NODE_2105_length_652_cov_87.904762_g2055_i0.p1  ORF type:complete len:165 (+),score=28.28 NODE_2105_length_652_cov_87.904762_g2055_i0:87-581(+)
MLRLVSRIPARVGCRTFFGNGYADNTSLEVLFKVMLRSPPVRERLFELYAANASADTLSDWSKQGSVGPLRVVLPPSLGDPHRVLLAYSMMAEDPVQHGADGCPVYQVDIGEESQLIKLVDADVIRFLGENLLETMGRDSSPAGAKVYIDEMLGIGGQAELATE